MSRYCFLSSVQGFRTFAAVALALSAAHCAHAALPAGYVELESITSTGSQYIQTGMLPTTSTTVEMDFNTGPNGTDTMFFGQAWNASQYLFCKKSDKYAFYGSGGQVSHLNPNTDAHVSITAENKFIIDYGSVAYTSTVSRAVSSSKFNIFADCDGGHKGSWTLYSLKIWNGGTAMRDFVPALRESDNAVGLYDVVGNTFYANSGSGAFISDKSLYHIAGSLDTVGTSSISGTLSGSTHPQGWADFSNSVTRIRDGITGNYEKYYFWCTNQTGSYHALRTPNNASYTSPATSEIVLLPKAYAYFFNKSCGTAASDGSVATLTFNNTTLCEDSILDLRCNSNGAYTYCTQIGGSFDIKEGATLRIVSNGTSDGSGTPCGVFRLTGKVTGSGAIESRLLNSATAVTTKTGSINQSITGDISEFTGDLVVYRANLTYPGDLKFELVNAASLPGDPPAGETSYVIVTNGATLVIDQDWVSPKNRIWDFGDGPRPTVEVAAGKTVEIKGAVRGSAGFKKTGAGTLVLSGASPSFSGECLISTGKVVLKGAAASLKDNFGTTAYLDAPCSSYINTGYRPNHNTRVVMDVTVQGKREYWFGVWDRAYNNGSFLAANDGASAGVVHFGFGNTFNNGPSLLSNGRHVVDFDKGVLWIDNAGKYEASSTSSFQLSNNLYLFLINKIGTPYVHDDEQGTIRMHSCRIYDNGTLVRDYTPRQRNGEWMLYEARSGSYVGNSGAGTFGGGISDSLEVIVGSVYYLR